EQRLCGASPEKGVGEGIHGLAKLAAIGVKKGTGELFPLFTGRGLGAHKAAIYPTLPALPRCRTRRGMRGKQQQYARPQHPHALSSSLKSKYPLRARRRRTSTSSSRSRCFTRAARLSAVSPASTGTRACAIGGPLS